MRQLTGEVRPVVARKVKPPPAGLLLAQEWLALIQFYELDGEGLPADDAQGLTYARIQRSTLARLQERGLVVGTPADGAQRMEKYAITEQGRSFYYQHYRTNALAYHRGQELPRPVLTAAQRAFWQQMEALNQAKDRALRQSPAAHEAVRCEMLTLQIAGPVHPLFVAPYWYVALAGRGIQLAPNIRLVESHLDMEEEAVAAGQELVERWKLQLSWLMPPT